MGGGSKHFDLTGKEIKYVPWEPVFQVKNINLTGTWYIPGPF